VVVQTLRAQVQAQGGSAEEEPAPWLELDDSLNLIALDMHRALRPERQ
jgi:hypothetical protein